jgi:hypothetical protein
MYGLFGAWPSRGRNIITGRLFSQAVSMLSIGRREQLARIGRSLKMRSLMYREGTGELYGVHRVGG